MQPDEVAELFTEHVVKHVFRGTVIGTKELLEGKSTEEQNAESAELAEWYRQLDAESQHLVVTLIRLSVDSAIFSFGTMLSGSASPEWEHLKIVLSIDGEEAEWDAADQSAHTLYRGYVMPWGPGPHEPREF